MFNSFVSGSVAGLLVGGAAMYYIQPTIKLWVAKAFGWGAKAAAEFEALAADARAMWARANPRTPDAKAPTESSSESSS
jgi:hypothetical protein